MSVAIELALSVALPPDGCENRPTVSVEHELVARALEGDGRAFAALVEPHLAMLYRIAARTAGSRALAEDAVQEALTVAYQRLKRYQPGTSLRAFLAAIAVRKAHTLLRAERRRKVREQAAEEPAGIAGPHELLNAQRVGRKIRQALSSMPKKRREVALLRLDGAMSYEEIASAVGSTEGSARVLVHLAMKELREKLQDVVAPESSR
jgi:RNA polymerase sigma factor (sigma-70 family)